MEPIDLAAPENAVPVIHFRLLDKLISLPITGPRVIMYKAAMMHAMGITKKSDLAKLDMAEIDVDEKQGIAAIDEILRDCPETKSLAGTLALPVYNGIIGRLNEIMFGEITQVQAESDVKKK